MVKIMNDKLTDNQVKALWAQAVNQSLISGIDPELWFYRLIDERNSALSDPRKSVYGVGIYEDGKYTRANAMRYIEIWKGMIWRCYRVKDASNLPSYKGCSVDSRFHKFQDFMAWAELQVGFDSDGYHLDKDLIVKGNKIYSPETCAFVPRALNNLLTNRRSDRGPYPVGVHKKVSNGRFVAACTMNSKQIVIGAFDTPEAAFRAYKATKEKFIKESAEFYRAKIDHRVYASLMSHSILITD